MASLVILLLSAAIIFITTRLQRQHLPPGPKPLPLIGNLFDFRRSLGRSYEVYAKWGKQYGEVISLSVFGQIIIVINSHRAAKELLDKRSTISADRPYFPLSHAMGAARLSVATMHYGDIWRKHRGIIDPPMRPATIVAYQPVQRQGAVAAIHGILSSPTRSAEQIKQFTVSSMMSIAYGYDVQKPDDNFIKVAERIGSFNRYFRPGALLANHVPLLRHIPSWVPGASFQKIAQKGRAALEAIIDVPFEFVKADIASGKARSSLVGQALMQMDDSTPEAQDERTIAEAFVVIYSGSVDTTSAVVRNFFLAMCLYPSVQRKAREEIDRVVGRDKLPDYPDFPNMPYVEALCQEVLRWKQPFPLCVPHATTEDSHYDGCLIPKGTTVLANIWAMLYDPEIFPEPNQLKPERFLTPDNKFIDNPLLSSLFGFGKRKCPGRHLAMANVWIMVVLVLATCGISDAVDAQGHMVTEDVEYPDEPLSVPPYYSFTITPRDAKAEEMLHAERAAM